MTTSAPPVGPVGPSRTRAHGAWPPGAVPPVPPDSLASISDEVAYWVETLAQETASALHDGTYAPFAARLTHDEQARYYGTTLFDRTGALAPQAYQAELARIGPQGLADALRGGARWREAHRLPVSLPPTPYQPTPMGDLRP